MLMKARQERQQRKTTPGAFRGNIIGSLGKPVRFSRNCILVFFHSSFLQFLCFPWETNIKGNGRRASPLVHVIYNTTFFAVPSWYFQFAEIHETTNKKILIHVYKISPLENTSRKSKIRIDFL